MIKTPQISHVGTLVDERIDICHIRTILTAIDIV